MRCWLRIAALVLGGAVFIGCDRPKATNGATAGPATTRPVADAPLPATRPTTSTLLIDGQVVSFPAARMVVQQKEPTVVLLLFSDDPRDAIDAKYNGNRYYFELKLDIDDPAQLSAAEWRYKATSVERADSPDGIFLEGDRKHLQPHDVRIGFATEGSTVNVDVQGQFLMFANRNEIAPPKIVSVAGTLPAEIKGKGR